MKLFDSHCHLDDEAYEEDLYEVISRAQHAGVTAIMTVGTDKESTVKAVDLADSRSGIYSSVGIHPHSAKDCSEETLEFMGELSENPGVLAWGEIGLDYNRMFSPIEDQEKWLRRQLEVAAGRCLPVILHERDSNGRLLQILKEYEPKRTSGVVHCFTGSRAELGEYLDLGYYIGITGIITMKGRGAFLRQMAPSIPENRLLIETDAPYLTPTPERNRQRRNEPAFVRSVLLKLAYVRNEDPEYLSSIIWENTCRLFGLEN